MDVEEVVCLRAGGRAEELSRCSNRLQVIFGHHRRLDLNFGCHSAQSVVFATDSLRNETRVSGYGDRCKDAGRVLRACKKKTPQGMSIIKKIIII